MTVFYQCQSECSNAPDIGPTYDRIMCVYFYQFMIYSDGETGFIVATCKGDKRRVQF